MSKQHNDANVLCLGATIVGASLAEEIVGVWVNNSFSGEERHRRRLAKVAEIEAAGER
jgi:ribose 5-phosphate isomerase B